MVTPLNFVFSIGIIVGLFSVTMCNGYILANKDLLVKNFIGTLSNYPASFFAPVDMKRVSQFNAAVGALGLVLKV